MRILVYPHDLNMGGSQTNAIEIAARMSADGHEISVFGRPGPLVAKIEDAGMEFIASVEPRRRPSPAVLRQLSQVIRERGIDIIHGYEWPPALDAWLVACRHRGVAAVGTIMSMSVAPFLPQNMSLIVGTPQIELATRRNGRRRVMTIKPPVDLTANHPEFQSGAAEFRRRWGLDRDSIAIVMVTRLAAELKLEGILSAIEAVSTIDAATPPSLVIVGSGPAAAQIRARAEAANARLGRIAVTLTGELLDPRPAYQAADIVLGMGGSALRGMAFAKPLIVQGERGFWRLLTPESLPDFEWTGWYGSGSGSSDGPRALKDALAQVLDTPSRRAELGQFGRSVVESHYGLHYAAARQLEAYEEALVGPPGPLRTVLDATATGYRYVSYASRRKARRLIGRALADDFNTTPVAFNGPTRQEAGRG